MMIAHLLTANRRLCVLPFEALIAFLAFISGVLALIHVGGLGQDALSIQLPTWLNTLTEGSYAVTGLAMLVGIGAAHTEIEAFGLVGVAVGVVVRAVSLVVFVGFTSLIVVALIFDAMIVVACGIRLRHLVQRRVLVLVEVVQSAKDAAA